MRLCAQAREEATQSLFAALNSTLGARGGRLRMGSGRELRFAARHRFGGSRRRLARHRQLSLEGGGAVAVAA